MARLAHVRTGQGPVPLLLLHGLLGSARNLGGLARGLVGRDPFLSVFALDLTGHGASPPLPPRADLATLAGDVLSTARSLGLDAPDGRGESEQRSLDGRGPLRIVGHSLGGRVALRAALLEPAAVGQVTLLDIGPSPLGEADDGVSRLLAALAAAPEAAPTRQVFRDHFRRAGVPDDLVAWLLLDLARDSDGYRWRIDRRAIADLHRRASREDLWSAVEGPRRYAVRCIRGGRSPFVPEADARRIAAAGGRVETLEGAGHFIHVERRRELVDLLLLSP